MHYALCIKPRQAVFVPSAVGVNKQANTSCWDVTGRSVMADGLGGSLRDVVGKLVCSGMFFGGGGGGCTKAG